MKVLYLLSSDGGFRRASSSQITDVLDGREASRIGTVTVDADGEAVPVVLTTAELDALREGLAGRRAAELEDGLDHALAARRRLEPINGVNMYGAAVSIYLEQAPWAEDAIRDWAERRALVVVDDPPPGATDRWTRHAHVNLGPEAWATSIITLVWPTVSLVAHDATLDGRSDDAQAINVAEQAGKESPF